MILKRYEKYISLFILISVLGGFLFFIEPRKTEAAAAASGGMAYCIAGVKATAVAVKTGTKEQIKKEALGVPVAAIGLTGAAAAAGTVGTKFDTFANCLKQHVLTPVYRMVAKMIIRKISQGIINWINSGFKGKPIFITNTNDFIKDAANQASGVVLEQLGMTALCENFKPYLAFSLRYTKPFEYRMRCTLKDVVKNIKDFEKDFSKGGWKGWLSLTVEPQNNPYGAYLQSVDEINRVKAEAQMTATMESSWGKGFMSLKKCEGGGSQAVFCAARCKDAPEEPGSSNFSKFCYDGCMNTKRSESQLCDLTGGKMVNTTPGTLITDQISGTLGSELRQLEVAKEIDEILAALVNQLWQKGLAALADSGSNGDGNNDDIVILENQRADTIKGINDTIQLEKDYRSIKEGSVAELENGKIAVEAKFNELMSSYRERMRLTGLVQAGIANGTLVLPANYTLTSSSTLQAEINNASITYSGVLDNFDSQKLAIKDEIAKIDDLISKLEALRDRAYSANGISALADVTLEFSSLTMELNSAGETAFAILERENIKTQVNDTIKQIQDGINTNNARIQELNNILLYCQNPYSCDLFFR